MNSSQRTKSMHHTARFLAVWGILFLFLGSTGIAVSYAYFVNGESASLVIGQPDFTTSTCVSSPPTKTGLCGSAWFTFDNAGNLWVADAGNNRVLRFKTPFSTLEAASMVIGQPDFTSGACATTQNGLCNPKGIAFDSSGNLWVGDRGNSRILEFKAPLSSGQGASLVLGQTSFTTGSCNTTQNGLCGPVGIVFDKSGNLWVADGGNNRVLKFDSPLFTGEPTSLVIGQAGFMTNACTTTQSGLCLPAGIGFGGSGNLWVADYGNSRALKFNAPFSNGEAASVVLGQPSFTTSACSTTESGLCNPIGIAFGPAGNLWISDGTNNRVLKFNAPFSNGELASRVIGQSDFTASTCATTQSGLCNPVDVGFDSSGNLWVSDLNNNRVLSYPRLTSD